MYKYTLFLFLFLSTAMFVTADETLNRYLLDGKRNIMQSEHLGIINHHLTIGTPYHTVGMVEGLWAPPYVSSDFVSILKIDGKQIPTSNHVWLPMKVEQEGTLDHISVKSQLLLIAGKRIAVQSVTFRNDAETKKAFTFEMVLSNNTLDWSDVWEFPIEQSRTMTTVDVQDHTLFLHQGKSAVIVATDHSTWSWDSNSRTGKCTVTLTPDRNEIVHFVFAIGEEANALTDVRDIVSAPEKQIVRSEKIYSSEFDAMYEKLPRFRSDNKELERLYDRSLMHFFTNRWNVDEFCLHPYYGTGGIRGGCVCNYLWNYGEIWEIIHLLDPTASQEHIKHFLGLNLTEHYAFSPVNGKAFGPWYMINQEKIIGHVYFYVKLTGDVGFLSQKVHGRTIMDHMLEHALALDDPKKPVELIDYGTSNSHLELRRKPNYYNHVMPDLNGRRYDNYVRVAALAEAYGEPNPFLLERAEALKKLLKEKLWNRETRWFDFINDQGKPESRYTIQMYKLIGSPVLDQEMEDGLLSHWNEKEFLGKYGLHSLALGDEAFDPADVDNGGPGACTSFPPLIAERFYKSGQHEIGADIIGRMLWLADRMPYWGDSFFADRIDYRHDTPLQCTLDGVSVAQCIIFGMFGIDVRFDGTIIIQPQLPQYAGSMSLHGINIRHATFDIEVDSEGFKVTLGKTHINASTGETVWIEKGRLVKGH